jgi:hypothetical protein
MLRNEGDAARGTTGSRGFNSWGHTFFILGQGRGFSERALETTPIAVQVSVSRSMTRVTAASQQVLIRVAPHIPVSILWRKR